MTRDRACEGCGNFFAFRAKAQRFCSGSCAAKHRTGSKNGRWDGGRSSHPLYHSYNDMIARCRRPSHARFADYGGRGITVCPEWQADFWQFVQDVGERPPGKWLDRIDNDGNYEPGNIRWVDASESNRNRRPTHLNRERNVKGQFQ